MTKCKLFIDKLALLALDELSEDEARQINQHLTECDSCTKHLEELLELTSALSQSPEDEITELEKLRVESAIYRRLAETLSTTLSRKWISSTLKLAASLALIALGYWSGTISSEQQPFRPEPPATASLLASLGRNENIASFRLSPQGLRLIARGRENLNGN